LFAQGTLIDETSPPLWRGNRETGFSVNFGTVLNVLRGRILRGFYEGGGAFLDSAKEELRGGLTVETFRGDVP
jgi:hypothetical protein